MFFRAPAPRALGGESLLGALSGVAGVRARAGSAFHGFSASCRVARRCRRVQRSVRGPRNSLCCPSAGATKDLACGFVGASQRVDQTRG